MQPDDIRLAECSEDLWDLKRTAEALGIGERRLRDGCNGGLYSHHRASSKGRLMFCPANRAQIARVHHRGARTAMPPRPRKTR
jgi:hypothetical protein